MNIHQLNTLIQQAAHLSSTTTDWHSVMCTFSFLNDNQVKHECLKRFKKSFTANFQILKNLRRKTLASYHATRKKTYTSTHEITVV